MDNSIQYNEQGRLQHLLDIESLNSDCIREILDLAQQFKHSQQYPQHLSRSVVARMFFENSTRTSCSFQIAAQHLDAKFLILDMPSSSTHKGETMLDTIYNLEAMAVDLFIIRHREPFFLHKLAQKIEKDISLVNAGDGPNEHPSQALLDAFTMTQHKKDFKQLNVVIVGDLKHSRVTRSNILCLQKLGVNEIRLVAPQALMIDQPEKYPGVKVYSDLKEAITDADVIMTLRLQHERMSSHLNLDLQTYINHYSLNRQNLSGMKKDAIIMHPGPLNRGAEISNEIADGPNSVILEQTCNGAFVRMAILSTLRKRTTKI